MSVFIGFVIFGTLIGAVTRLLVAGRAGGWAGSISGGAGGGLLGGFVGRIDGLQGPHESAGFGLALVGAFVVVVTYHFVAAARRGRAVASLGRASRGRP